MIRVLVVDDHAIVRERPRATARRRRRHDVVATPANGAEALAATASQDVDVVLMDLSMPGMDGVEATRG